MIGKIQHILWMVVLLAFAVVGCEKQGNTTPTAEQMVARYPVSVYTKMGSRDRDHYVATLNKAEEVTVLDIETPEAGEKGQDQSQEKKKEKEYAKVKLSDGKTGYLEARHLAREAVVVTAENLKIYKRPNITSGTGYGEEHIRPGMVAFIEETDFQNGEWFLISGSGGKGKYFKGWTTAGEGVTRDVQTVVAAVRLEKALDGIKPGSKEAERKESIEELENLANSAPTVIARIARGKLDGIDERAEDAEEMDTDTSGQEDTEATDGSGDMQSSDQEPASQQ